MAVFFFYFSFFPILCKEGTQAVVYDVVSELRYAFGRDSPTDETWSRITRCCTRYNISRSSRDIFATMVRDFHSTSHSGTVCHQVNGIHLPNLSCTSREYCIVYSSCKTHRLPFKKVSLCLHSCKTNTFRYSGRHDFAILCRPCFQRSVCEKV